MLEIRWKKDNIDLSNITQIMIDLNIVIFKEKIIGHNNNIVICGKNFEIQYFA